MRCFQLPYIPIRAASLRILAVRLLEELTRELLDSSSRMVHLPADDAIPARLGRAAAVVRGWLPEARPPTPPTAEHSEAAEPPPKRARGGPSRHEVIDLT